MNLHRWPVALVLATLVSAGAGSSCSTDRSYVHVTVRTMEGELNDVAQLIVYVTNGIANCDILYYPKTIMSPRPAQEGGPPYRVTPTDALDFSVSFDSSFEGQLRIGVEPRNAADVSLGYGEVAKSLDPGHTVDADLAVVLHKLPPPLVNTKCLGMEVPPCDPATAGSCGAGQTCHLTCSSDDRPLPVCKPAGTAKPGQPCNGIGDCEPGSQCFEYSCGSPHVKVCVKFCKSDGECGEGRCSTQVPCKEKDTGLRTCSLACDPRASGVGTCAPGLSCFIFPGEVARCDCGDDRRTGEDGAACTDARDCKAGHLCVDMAPAGRVCRPICRLDTPTDCASLAGRACKKLMNPDYNVWGACLP